MYRTVHNPLTKPPGKIMKTGRPREFDPEKVLDRALKVFWKKGYDGTSMSDLTEAMGINKPSLYAAFGDKESLFRKAIDRYVEMNASHIQDALNEPTAQAVAQKLWTSPLANCANSRGPRGCFLVQGSLASSDTSQALQRAVINQRNKGEDAIRERFERAVVDGDLPPNTNAADLARFVSTMTYGLAVQAASGVSIEDLQAVAEIAIQSIPRMG
jgi:AcrR family transcriptional regulator